jgi:hypothetical protein
MGKNWRARDERRRLQEEERERQAQIEAEALEAKDRLPLEYIIDFDCNDMEGVRYVLRRLAKAQALQLDLMKRNLK